MPVCYWASLLVLDDVGSELKTSRKVPVPDAPTLLLRLGA